MLIPDASSLRQPPANLGRRQVLVLDGIRYSTEMAHVAYERLSGLLQGIAASTAEPSTRDIATAMLDAWSIVDSAHRMRDLIAAMPGLPNSPWRRAFSDRTTDIAELRDAVQHQLGELNGLVASGAQLWGYLSWAAHRDGQHTGKWLMMAAGTLYAGDQWLFMGPLELPFPVPNGRIRLNAFGKQVYLGRTVVALIGAAKELEGDLNAGRVRPIVPHEAQRTGADAVIEGTMQMVTGPARPFSPSEPPSSDKGTRS